MEFKKLKELLLLFKKEGTLQISYAGGEPTIHPHYPQIIKFSRKLGFYITVSTNGLNKNILTLGREALPHFFSVSLDGPPSVHNLYRGKGSGEQALEFLYLLKKYKISRAINTVIGRHNCSIDSIKWLLEKAEELEASFNFQFMLPFFDSKEEANPYAPSFQEMKRLVNQILSLKPVQRRRLIFGKKVLEELLTWDSLAPGYRIKKDKTCYAGKYFAFVSPSFILIPCSILEGHPWYKDNSILKKGFRKSLETIQNIPCNDCFLGCNLLRNDIFSLNWTTLKGVLRMITEV